MARIMIVDDNYYLRKSVESILEKLGHEVVGEATDGSQVLLKYAECAPDIVTMDILMASKNGLEALKELKDAFPESKVVMLTSLAQKAKVIEAVKSGADYYIIKPFQANELENAMDRVIRRLLKASTGEESPATHAEADEPSALSSPALSLGETAPEESLVRVLNEDGFHIVSILAGIDQDMLDLINRAVQGLLMKSPLRIVFKLASNKFESKETAESFYRIVNKVQMVGGICAVERPS